MGVPREVVGQLGDRFAALLPHLNERQRRLALAVEARLLGHGGVGTVARVARVSETTVRRGLGELEAGAAPWPDGRVRAPGGGRWRAEHNDPAVLGALLGLVEPDERGDPESPLRWTTKSLRHLAEELTRQGHPVSAPTVGRLLRSMDFSLQANAKTLERRSPAPGSRCPVQLYQRPGQGAPGRWRAGDQRGRQEAGTVGPTADGRAGVAFAGRARGGGVPQLLLQWSGGRAGDPVRDL